MGLDNPLHLAFIVVLLLLVFGAKRLPEIGKSLGSGMRGFKESISGESHHELGGAHNSTLVVPVAPTAPAQPVVTAVTAPVQPVVTAEPVAAQTVETVHQS